MNPIDNPIVWYAMYDLIRESTPEIMDQFIERTAAKMELTVDYFAQEFL